MNDPFKPIHLDLITTTSTKYTKDKMRYLIFCTDKTCFATEWFGEEMFNPETTLLAADLVTYTFTTDGKEWAQITFDHL